MDKESRYELQKVDCNCNDCKFMVRDLDKYNESVALHHKWQLDYFNAIKEKTKDETMRFQFDRNEAMINYGWCQTFNQEVTFIPNVCQLDTQECFTHRKD